MLTGIGVSPGVAVGPVRRVTAAKVEASVPANLPQVLEALEKVAQDLDTSAAHIELEIAKDVLAAQAMMARDPSLVEVLSASLSDEVNPDVRDAINGAFDGFKAALTAIGGYFAERVSDLDEISNRLIGKLAGTESSGLVLTAPSILS